MSKLNKHKILILRDWLIRNTDKDHASSIEELQEMLKDNGVEAERKALYSDLETLKCGKPGCGLDIRRKGWKYYVENREFTLEEVKILIDMLQSSNFISAEKTDELINKLEGLVSAYQARTLSRQVYVRGKVKTMNGNVYESVDLISDAINSNKKISFKYKRFNIKTRQREFTRDGAVHTISPFALIYTDQNYYMIGYGEDTEKLIHFRVDRMAEIIVTDQDREGAEAFEKVDITKYTSKVFYMFTGEERQVSLRCENSIVEPFVDRFGTELVLVPDGPSHFKVLLNVVVSPQFYAWLVPFGDKAQISGPDDVREGMKKHLESILKEYN